MVSLADLRKNPPTSRLERTFPVLTDVSLSRKISDLEAERRELAASRKQADRIRERKILDDLAALADELDAKTGSLVLRANLTSGEWRRFIDENPARPEGETGHARDQSIALGVVNADALIDSLHLFAAEWEGEPLEEGDFALIFDDTIPPADLLLMAQAVVLLYEASPDFSKWRTALPADLERLRESVEHEISASLPSDSTAGSPEPSSADSTKTATPAP